MNLEKFYEDLGRTALQGAALLGGYSFLCNYQQAKGRNQVRRADREEILELVIETEDYFDRLLLRQETDGAAIVKEALNHPIKYNRYLGRMEGLEEEGEIEFDDSYSEVLELNPEGFFS